MKSYQLICSILFVVIFSIIGSSIAYATDNKEDKDEDDKSACFDKVDISKKCLTDNGYDCGTAFREMYCTKKNEKDWHCSTKEDCTAIREGRDDGPIKTKPPAGGDVLAPEDPPAREIPNKIKTPDDQVMASEDPQKPDLLIDSIEVFNDLVTRENGFTYVSMEIRIANAGSANTTVPFKISSGYYDYQDDVGPSSHVVPDQVNQRIEAGGAITLVVDVAVPYPNGLESPFSINIELDSCSSNDANMDTSVCRIDEESEGNNSGEVTL